LKKLLYLLPLLGCLMCGHGWGQIAIVQTATNKSGGVSNANIPCAFASTPTVGNVMVACVSWRNASSTLTNPTGWTTGVTDPLNGAQAMRLAYRAVQNGDGTTYTWVNSISDRWSLKCYEVSGVNTTTPLDGTPGTVQTTSATVDPGTVTPTGGQSDLPLSCAGADASSGTFSTSSSGWTIDSVLTGDFHGSDHASHTNSSSAQHIIWTAGGTGSYSAITWLLQPSGGSSPTGSTLAGPGMIAGPSLVK
jgi:hypothetical protein